MRAEVGTSMSHSMIQRSRRSAESKMHRSATLLSNNRAREVSPKRVCWTSDSVIFHCSLLVVVLTSLLTSPIHSFQEPFGDGGPQSEGAHHSAIEGLFGSVAKTLIYGGAQVTRLNSRVLCALLKRETGRDNQEQPTMFLFRSSLNKDHAFRIYSDDEITHDLVEEAQLDPRQATVIFVHGWLGGIHNEYWLSEAKNVALKSSDEIYPETDSYLNERFSSSIDDPVSRFARAPARTNHRHRDFLDDFGPLEVEEDDDGDEHDDEQAQPPPVRQYRPNVIVVEWSDFAHGSLFTATQNSHKVARRLGRLLERLASVGQLRPELMHCLGHSIGAHICGQAARQAFPAQPQPAGSAQSSLARRRRMGRITALDPGGFCYELGIRNESTYLGLRPSDALLTDAYYSNRSPFGNKYQVAQYNVRLNNGFFQAPCSVWRNSTIGTEYFRASVRFMLGNIGHNDVLTCDHYFATRFAHQAPPGECSYVAYACDNYRNFVRGRCAKCSSENGLTVGEPLCYPMDFEYQRAEPSNARALQHIRRHSSLLNTRFTQVTFDSPAGGVPYGQRRSYYMRVANKGPYCSYTYRVRLVLSRDILNLKTFRADAVQLQLSGIVTIRDSSTNKLTSGVLSLYGPWLDGGEQDFFGLNNRTLTGMFELNRPEKIRGLLVAYDNDSNRQHLPYMRLIESVHFDYLSSIDPKIKAKYSSSFEGDEVDVEFKRLNLDGTPSTGRRG